MRLVEIDGPHFLLQVAPEAAAGAIKAFLAECQSGSGADSSNAWLARDCAKPSAR
jgi:hypothetical protein